MIGKVFIILSLCFLNVSNQIDKTEFYAGLSSSSLTSINSLIEKLEQEKPNSLYIAYKGGLFMKKSSLLTNPKEKLKWFKMGRTLLEKEIGDNPNRVEYRFIRLTIQEHAPALLKYNQNMIEDKIVIEKNYSKLDYKLKEIILDYSSKSSILDRNRL